MTARCKPVCAVSTTVVRTLLPDALRTTLYVNFIIHASLSLGIVELSICGYIRAVQNVRFYITPNMNLPPFSERQNTNMNNDN